MKHTLLPSMLTSTYGLYMGHMWPYMGHTWPIYGHTWPICGHIWPIDGPPKLPKRLPAFICHHHCGIRRAQRWDLSEVGNVNPHYGHGQGPWAMAIAMAMMDHGRGPWPWPWPVAMVIFPTFVLSWNVHVARKVRLISCDSFTVGTSVL